MGDYNLTHPVYLDVQMMYSFLAYLEGGFSLEDEHISKLTSAQGEQGKGSAKVKLPTLAHFFGAEASIEKNVDAKSEGSSEYKAQRHRTAASLFNYLYTR